MINHKLLAVQDAITEILFSGAFDRYPQLRLVLVENEVGWIPFFIDQLDYYYKRFEGKNPAKLERPPSQIFEDQIFATFFRDPNAALVAQRYSNLMWSSDYPHGNSTWPNSQQVVEDRLGGLPDDDIDRIVRGTAARLFGIGPNKLAGTHTTASHSSGSARG